GEVQLEAGLAGAVWIAWTNRMPLVGGKILELAVHAAARGRVDDLADAVTAGGLEQVDSPLDVDVRVDPGILHRRPHVAARRLVADDVEAAVPEQGVGLFAANVERQEAGLRVDVFLMARRQVVDRRNVV